MNTRKFFILKSIAIFLILTIVTEVISPTVAYALTSGPTQPDVYGNQPVDATDNVSLVTGDFNYTIPVTSIPEYPMAIGYSSSGLGMDQEAGAFGFGVNSFSGAIGRNLQGLPDDLKNGPRRYKAECQQRWDASLTGSISAGLPVPELPQMVSPSISLTVGYNNYTGMYGAAGLNIGLKIPTVDGGPVITGSIGFQTSSLYGASANIGLQCAMLSYTGSGTDIRHMHSKVHLFQNIRHLVKHGKDDINDLVNAYWNIQVTDFPPYTGNVTSAYAPLADVVATNKSFGISTPGIPIPAPPTTITLSGRFSIQNFGNDDNVKNSYGFMYLNNYDNSQRSHLADMTVEGEFSYNNVPDKDFRNSPAYLQRDAFTVSSQGLSGTMQLYQEEYGAVSRNYNRLQSRDLSLIGLHTERKEVEAWSKVSKAVINKNLDILKLLKSSDEEGDKDFDKTIFTEKTLVDLRSADRTFGTEAKFKMRGDMAGEFNLSSSSSTDFQPNNYELLYISGTGGDSRISFLKEEKDMPMYYPNPVSATQNNYKNANNKIRRSTNITSYKVSQLLSTYPAATVNLDPESNVTAPSVLNFRESFFNHTRIKSNSYPSKGNPVQLTEGSNVENFNILKHLQNLKSQASGLNAQNGYFDDLIADIRVKNAEGLTYIYNLPVFCKGSKNLSLSGKGVNAPVKDGTDYSSFSQGGSIKKRNKNTVTEEYYYPYAWLLTAVVGADYIDFDDIPGPSDGDLGYWVKFRYLKTADNYRWRAPFIGMEHYPNAIHTNDDDAYSASTGIKEIYQISEIESSQHTSKYVYHQRLDGVEAAGGGSMGDIYNRDAKNSLSATDNIGTQLSDDPTGSNCQYVCTKIQLYRKNSRGDNSRVQPVAERRGKLLRETQFWYDYSLCPNVLNNYARYRSGIMQSNVPYHIGTSSAVHAGTGKLTLKKVQHISYEGGSPVSLPSYELKYKNEEPGAYAEMNPDYNYKQQDLWNNYSNLSKLQVTNTASPSYPVPLNYYTSYTEIDKVQADKNAQAFKLSKVFLPGGGAMAVTFEANSYGKVQDQTPYAMRHVLTNISTDVTNSGNKKIKIKVDITDLDRDGKDLSAIINPADQNSNKVYGELAFYESFSPGYPSREDQVFISTEDQVRVTSITANKTIINGRVYQEIVLSNNNADIPFIAKYKQYLFGGSNKMKAIKEQLSSGSSCDLNAALAKYDNMDKDGPWDALKKMTANARNYFMSDNTFRSRFVSCFWDPDQYMDRILFSHLSFLRTPVYKAKYTGSKVKSITYTDNFQYATLANGSVGPHDNVYTTNYFSDENGNGTGVSTGVATVEPGGGKAAVIDIYNKQGAGFMPGPSIVYAKTTVETAYQADPANPAVGDKISRKKGKTEYYFYTAADNDYKFEKNFAVGNKISQPGSPNGRFFMFGLWSFFFIKFRIFGKRIVIKVPFWFPLTVRWKREDKYHLKAYSYLDQTDMFGKPKSIVHRNSNNEEVSSQVFNYFGKTETLKTYDGSSGGAATDPFTNTALQKMIRPGRMDQSWSESYYTKESKIELIPWILFMNAHTNRNFSYTNMKYTYLPSVLKEVINKNSIDGTIATATYTGFDHYTGQPVEINNYDSYGKTKIQRVVPAYWKYPALGPVTDANPDNLNLLTQATANYLYLNTVSNNTILSAGITEWSKDSWQFVSGIRPAGKTYSNGSSSFNYNYEVISNDILEKIYGANGKTRSGLPAGTAAQIVNTYVKDAKFLYKPYKSYTYETTLNSDGTFNITNFNYAGAQTDAKWKLTSTVTKYSMDGTGVESKDILDKYAASYFGYNMSNSVSVVSNASYGAAAYAGAENSYSTSSGLVLDDPRVSLGNADIVEECSRDFINKTLVYNNLTANPGARVLTICTPTNPTLNTYIAKVDVVYAHNTAIKRSLYIEYNANREFRIVSDRGEDFKGFYVTPALNAGVCTSGYKISFDPSIFQSFTIDNSFTASGYNISSAIELLPACAMPDKAYKIPSTNCIGIAHTGTYAFGLSGNKTGTNFDISIASLPATEAARKYKAMVWVHNTSPAQTQLVAQKVVGTTTTVIKTASLSNPYVTIGEWSLLRVEVDPSEYTGASTVSFYVKNASTGGLSIYDDFRVLPYQGSMQNYVYDPFTGRVTATLNGDNFATFYKYDSKGRLSEVKAEIENAGKQTIKKYLYNEQKTN